MKKIIISFAVVASFISMAFTGTNACDGNENFVQGVKTKMGYYNSDGKQTGTGTSEVTKVYTSGDSTVAILNSTYTDTKKNEPHSSEVKMACVNGTFVMDMSGAMNTASQQSGHDMKVVCKGNMIAYKTSYTVGEKLDDINMIMETYSNGSLFSTTNIVLTNRKIEAFDDVKVPAGTYKCYKISYTTNVTMMMGSIKIPGIKPFNSVMFYSTTAGMVRSESYKDDKLSSYNELLELNKP